MAMSSRQLNVGRTAVRTTWPLTVSLVAAWAVVTGLALLIVPAYRGDLGGRSGLPVIVAIIGVAAALVLRGAVPTVRAALLSAVPALGCVAAAATVAAVMDPAGNPDRGEPIGLYLGITLWVSWASLVLATVLIARTRWSGVGALALTAVVALLGWACVTFQVD